jgi:hypothetical protein
MKSNRDGQDAKNNTACQDTRAVFSSHSQSLVRKIARHASTCPTLCAETGKMWREAAVWSKSGITSILEQCAVFEIRLSNPMSAGFYRQYRSIKARKKIYFMGCFFALR